MKCEIEGEVIFDSGVCVARVEESGEGGDLLLVCVLGCAASAVLFERGSHFEYVVDFFSGGATPECDFQLGAGPHIGAISRSGFEESRMNQAAQCFTDGIAARTKGLSEFMLSGYTMAHRPFARLNVRADALGDLRGKRLISLNAGGDIGHLSNVGHLGSIRQSEGRRELSLVGRDRFGLRR